MSELRITGVEGIGEVEAGADIAALTLEAAPGIVPGDIVVIAQKIVSKAEGRLVAAHDRDDARAAAKKESRRILRETPNYLIVETHQGLVCAAAGVDMSNVPDGYCALLPKNPDSSAARIRTTIEDAVGPPVAVIISDTFGRAWRIGQTNVAIGASGIDAVRSYVGQTDPAGRELVVTEIAHLDELAGAAELVMGKLDGVPVAIVRGYRWEPGTGTAADINRPFVDDLFR